MTRLDHPVQLLDSTLRESQQATRASRQDITVTARQLEQLYGRLLGCS